MSFYIVKVLNHFAQADLHQCKKKSRKVTHSRDSESKDQLIATANEAQAKWQNNDAAKAPRIYKNKVVEDYIAFHT